MNTTLISKIFNSHNHFYYPKSQLLLAVVCFFSSVSYSQDTAIAKIQYNKYVKIEIGHHILDCPVLPSNLKRKLMELEGISDYKVDKETESIRFIIPQGVITQEQIATIAKDAGFPADDIKVFMDDKPFVK